MQSDLRVKHITVVLWIEKTSCFHFTGHLWDRRKYQGYYKIEFGSFKWYKPQTQMQESDFCSVLEDVVLLHDILKLQLVPPLHLLMWCCIVCFHVWGLKKTTNQTKTSLKNSAISLLLWHFSSFSIHIRTKHQQNYYKALFLTSTLALC